MSSRYHHAIKPIIAQMFAFDSPALMQSFSAGLQSLGDHVSLQAVATVLDSVRYHGSSGIGFTDFIDIMSRDSQDLKEGSHNRSNGNATTAYNIALMARAYRWLMHLSMCMSATAPEVLH